MLEEPGDEGVKKNVSFPRKMSTKSKLLSSRWVVGIHPSVIRILFSLASVFIKMMLYGFSGPSGTGGKKHD